MVRFEVREEGRLVWLCYSDHVQSGEVSSCFKRLEKLLDDIKPGFCVLADFTGLEGMDGGCALHIGTIMDLLREKGVKLVVRVIPDPHKDIGMNILTFFHYGPDVRTETHDTLAGAIESLAPRKG